MVLRQCSGVNVNNGVERSKSKRCSRQIKVEEDGMGATKGNGQLKESWTHSRKCKCVCFTIQIAVLTSFYFKSLQAKYENSLWCTKYKSKHEC